MGKDEDIDTRRPQDESSGEHPPVAASDSGGDAEGAHNASTDVSLGQRTLSNITEAANSIDSLIEDHEEEVSEDGRTVKRRGVYLLPNLFTTGALFCGFYAVVAAMRGDFASAPIAVLFALVFDGLDGRVARLTNTSSKFGAEYDSLADMVSFGVAPALVMFSWALGDLGKAGWSAAFIYVACTALRLARFNTQVGVGDPNYFMGLASPAAACGGLRQRRHAAVRGVELGYRGLGFRQQRHRLGHLGPDGVVLVGGQRDGREDADDRDHDHQFDKGEALLPGPVHCVHVRCSCCLCTCTG